MTTPSPSACTISEAGAPIFNPALQRKPRVGVFSLTGCEGCSLAILELESELFEILQAVEIVNYREASSRREFDIDLAFVDGAISTPHDEEQARGIRARCRTLVAIGACACLGGINTLKNYEGSEHARLYVYGGKAPQFPTTDARPLRDVVRVDYELPGCPMVKEEFLRFTKCALTGRPFVLPNYPVCVECKRRGTLCMYERGEFCLGPVTRAGCNAICPRYGAKCDACRGVLGDESLAALAQNLRQHYDVPLERVLESLRRYGAHRKDTLP